MIHSVAYCVNQASAEQVAEHLALCDPHFVPPLAERVDIGVYAAKLVSTGIRFEAWSGATMVALVAGYVNDRDKQSAYVTSVSVLSNWTGQGIGSRLLNRCISHARAIGMRQVRLEVVAIAIRLQRWQQEPEQLLREGFLVVNPVSRY